MRNDEDSERGGRDLKPSATNENGALDGIKDNAHTSEVPAFRGAAQGPQRLLAQSSEIEESRAMSDESKTRGIEVHTGSRIGYAHPSLSRDEVERLDRLRDEAGDRAGAELVERALFDGDAEALAALGFHAVEVEPGDMHPGTLPGLIGTAARDPSLAVAPTPSVHGATYSGTLTVEWVSGQPVTVSMIGEIGRGRSRAETAEARAETAEAQLAALREAAGRWPLIGWDGGSTGRHLDTVLADAAAAAEAYTRRVRAEALAEASRILRNVGARDRQRYTLAEAAEILEHRAERAR